MCSRSSVQWGVSEYMVRFLEKNKNKTKKKKQVKFKNHQMRKLQVVWQSWLILLLSWFFFSKWVYYDVDDLTASSFVWKNANIQSSCSIISSLISPKALSCTFLRRGSAVFLWPVWMKFILNIFDRNIDQAMAQQLIR